MRTTTGVQTVALSIHHVDDIAAQRIAECHISLQLARVATTSKAITLIHTVSSLYVTCTENRVNAFSFLQKLCFLASATHLFAS